MGDDTGKTEQKPKRRKRRPTRSGGAWRAFCHERSKGNRFTAQSLQKLAEEYRQLSTEDKQRYVEIGKAGTFAHQKGFPAFGQNARKRKRLHIPDKPTHPGPGETTDSGALVVTDPATELDVQLAFDGTNGFLDTYTDLKRSTDIRLRCMEGSGDVTLPLDLTKDEIQAVQEQVQQGTNTWFVQRILATSY